MKTLSLIVRRVHLYLTLICLPWFLMYGITAFAFNHKDWFGAVDDLYNVSGPNWTKLQSWPCTAVVPDEGDIPREVTAEVLAVASIRTNAFHAYRSGKRQISAYEVSFWHTRRVVYDIDQRQATLYVRKRVAPSTMTLMHSRGGYHHDSILNDLWAVMVDTVAIGLLLWVASGLFMWWQQRRLRALGIFVLLAGGLAFVGFLICL